MSAFIYLDRKINIIDINFVKKLGIKIWYINLDIPKIDGFKLDIFGIVIKIFLIKDKKKRFWFFEEIFLFANLKINITLEMTFIILSNVKVNFGN